MKRYLSLAALLIAAPVSAAELPKPLATGMVNPESVVVGPDGKIYVTVIGEFDKDGDGAVVTIENGKAVPFVKDLDDPKGIALFQNWLFVTDKTKVLRINRQTGKSDVFAAAKAFPVEPKFLNDVVVDPENGLVYVSDSGAKGSGGAVYRINQKGGVSLVVDEKKLPGLNTPNGLTLDGSSHLILADFGAGTLHRIKLVDGSNEKIAEGMDGADGLTWDYYGRLFVSSWKTGKLFVIPRPGDKPVLVAEGFKSAADTCLDATGKFILVPDMKGGTLNAVLAQVPGAPVDDTALPLKTEVAFPDLKWTGWNPETASGRPNPLRPLVLTHAGDGSNRVFVGTQHGVIHVFPNDQKATETKVFLDIQDRVKYNDNTNEEGFLGMAFHPKFKTNGEVFVFYTPKKENKVNVVSRFKLSKDDPTKLDPASEEQIIRFENKLFWNHDGGTVLFGPDGYLYVIHGDGGAANDPQENGQNLGVLYGKILRLDVDNKADGKNYAIPKDNPFVDKKGARPEIWAYGIRNIWRMSFDRKTGKLWAGEVGQNLYEEINIIEKGGNYGWNIRESLHPFGAKGVGPRKDLIDPIWEYHHNVGKSITGGGVYRGKALPELEGHYLYADYVTSKIWALKYDETAKRVTANRTIKDPEKPVLSFGEDEQGEMYFLIVAANGKGIYRFVKQ
ncbi:Soluble aldose sugar dehydrogenase YliI precursor [Gemmata sp. SH-PL17]|uniref:PQQ-dependent sugar dehydrogenase n=1 Tax=Gemmata sp. SH-PL17 TaxID=1630693 RepID=UPI00078B36AE|nr:PQQ-dependent sugar dehydrogenase [Gemmata sp. SH-PL17]AMV29873.1 Soluble aldose sugar dehydrogenase YliI precursor [Gemmata sp. SH-PL17]